MGRPPQPAGPLAPREDLSSFVTVTYTLIPLSEKAQATPAIPFSYFDPRREAYLDLTIPAQSVTVEPGASPAEVAALLKQDEPEPEPEPGDPLREALEALDVDSLSPREALDVLYGLKRDLAGVEGAAIQHAGHFQ